MIYLVYTVKQTVCFAAVYTLFYGASIFTTIPHIRRYIAFSGTAANWLFAKSQL